MKQLQIVNSPTNLFSIMSVGPFQGSQNFCNDGFKIFSVMGFAFMQFWQLFLKR